MPFKSENRPLLFFLVEPQVDLHVLLFSAIVVQPLLARLGKVMWYCEWRSRQRPRRCGLGAFLALWGSDLLRPFGLWRSSCPFHRAALLWALLWGDGQTGGSLRIRQSASYSPRDRHLHPSSGASVLLLITTPWIVAAKLFKEPNKKKRLNKLNQYKKTHDCYDHDGSKIVPVRSRLVCLFPSLDCGLIA